MPSLYFKGKSAVWNYYLSVPYHTLEKDNKDSIKGDNDDENLIIEGDNLLALKALLPKYQGEIDCIYIDIIIQRLIQFNYSIDNLPLAG